MPSEKFNKCGSLICNENFLPFLLIKSSVNSTLHPLKTVNWPLLVSDLTWSLLSHLSFSCQIMWFCLLLFGQVIISVICHLKHKRCIITLNIHALHYTLRWGPGFGLIRVADTPTLASPLSPVSGLHSAAKKEQRPALYSLTAGSPNVAFFTWLGFHFLQNCKAATASGVWPLVVILNILIRRRDGWRQLSGQGTWLGSAASASLVDDSSWHGRSQSVKS